MSAPISGPGLMLDGTVVTIVMGPTRWVATAETVPALLRDEKCQEQCVSVSLGSVGGARVSVVYSATSAK